MGDNGWIDEEERTVVLDVSFPAGVSTLDFGEIQVAGVSFRPRNVEMLMDAGIEIWLLREADNPHDENAVAVMGSWRWKNGKVGEGKIGFLPAHVAAEVVSLADAATLAVRPTRFVLPIPGRASGLVFVELGVGGAPVQRAQLHTTFAAPAAPAARPSSRRRARAGTHALQSASRGGGCALTAFVLLAPLTVACLVQSIWGVIRSSVNDRETLK